MGRQTSDHSQLFYLFNLEQRIPGHHFLRRINPIVTRILASLRDELQTLLQRKSGDLRSIRNSCCGCSLSVSAMAFGPSHEDRQDRADKLLRTVGRVPADRAGRTPKNHALNENDALEHCPSV
jgi:hypothetical protein